MAMIHYTFRGSLDVTVYGLGAFGLMTVNLVLFLVAFSTQGWGWIFIYGNSGETIGLWTKCRDVGDNPLACETLMGSQESPGTVVAAQCFAITTLIIFVMVVGTNILYLFVKRFNQDKRVLIALTFSCCVCGASLLLTISLWAAGFNKYTTDILKGSNIRFTSPVDFDTGFGYSFFIAVTSCVLTLTACVLYVTELRYNKYLIPA